MTVDVSKKACCYIKLKKIATNLRIEKLSQVKQVQL